MKQGRRPRYYSTSTETSRPRARKPLQQATVPARQDIGLWEDNYCTGTRPECRCSIVCPESLAGPCGSREYQRYEPATAATAAAYHHSYQAYQRGHYQRLSLPYRRRPHFQECHILRCPCRHLLGAVPPTTTTVVAVVPCTPPPTFPL